MAHSGIFGRLRRPQLDEQPLTPGRPGASFRTTYKSCSRYEKISKVTETRKKQILEDNGLTFIDKIDVSLYLLTHLVSKKVITSSEKDDIFHTEEPSRRGNKLLTRLLKATVLQFVIFCIILYDEYDRADIVEEDWGLSIEHLRGQRDEMVTKQINNSSRTGNRKKARKWTPDLSEGVTSHREFYQRELMTGRLFDIKDLNLGHNTSTVYDMKKCFIKIVATSDEILSKPGAIPPEDMLSNKDGKAKPKTALLSGHPGAGKSSLVKYFVYLWSKLENGEGEWDLIVILDVSTLDICEEDTTIEDRIMEAIKQSLMGSDKEAIMESLKDNSHKVLIVPDGMDECRSRATRQMLKDLVNGCYKGQLNFTVLATSRYGLSPVDESLFNRRMRIDGFTIEEGIEYVKKFYSEIMKPAGDDAQPCENNKEQLILYIEKHTQELAQILKNPLCVHVLSVVTADGTLKLTKEKTLKRKELFQSLERSMKNRQREKHPKEFEDDAKRFYNMSLYALLKDKRTFDESLLREFGIEDHHAYMTFMTMKQDQRSHDKGWKFNHEIFNEYFAACALEALPSEILSTFLLLLCSRKEFRNTQKLLFSALSREFTNAEILSDMICATLILQYDRKDQEDHSQSPEHVSVEIIEDSFKLQESELSEISLASASAIQSYDDPLTFLLPDHGTRRNSTINLASKTATKSVWQDIKNFFKDKAVRSQKCGLFLSMIEEDAELVKHVHDCLNEVPEELQRQLFESSIGRFLPSMKEERRVTVYKTGGTRWSTIEFGHREATVVLHAQSWCLKDMTEAFKQYQQQDHQSTIVNHLGHGVVQLGIQTESHLSLGMMDGPSLLDMEHDAWAKDWSDLIASISACLTNTKLLVINIDDVDDNCAKGFLDSLRTRDTQDNMRDLLARDFLKMFRCIDLTQGEENEWALIKQCAMPGGVKVMMKRPRKSPHIVEELGECCVECCKGIAECACGCDCDCCDRDCCDWEDVLCCCECGRSGCFLVIFLILICIGLITGLVIGFH